MLITVKYFGLPAAYLSNNTQHIEIPDATTVEQLLDHIFTKLGDRNIEFMESATILVNKAKAQSHTVLLENDEVFIMCALGGG